MGNYFNELRWKIIRANNLLQLIYIYIYLIAKKNYYPSSITTHKNLQQRRS